MALHDVASAKAAGIETDLADAALESFLAAAEAAIVKASGAVSGAAAVTEDLDGGGTLLYPSRPIASITSASALADDDTLTALEADTFRLVFEGRAVKRLGSRRWPSTVRLVYTPVDDDETRKAVQLRLLRLELSHRGFIRGESDGSWSAQYGDDYERARERILDAVRPAFGGIA